MLQITLPAGRGFDERTEEFVLFPAVTLRLEHSLISIHKWEAKWHKSYLNNAAFTPEEWTDYIRCMSLDGNLDPAVLQRLRAEDFMRIRDYVADPMTATTIHHRNPSQKGRGQIVTAELIYYWMTEFGIPFSCAKWPLNQLMTLIEVCSIKKNPNNKMSKSDSARYRAMMNAAHRRKTGSRG